VFEGVTATLVMPRTSIEAGQDLPVVVRLRNDRADPVSFTLFPGANGEAFVYGVRGGAIHGTDVIVGHMIDLAPGETDTVSLTIGTTSCADVPEDPEPALPAGSYGAGFRFSFSQASSQPTSTPSPSSSPGLPLGEQSASPTPTPAPMPSYGEFALRVDVTVV